MIVYMLETRRGSPDGFTVKRYHEGSYYEVPHTLGVIFLNNDWAIEIPEEDIGDGANQVDANRIERDEKPYTLVVPSMKSLPNPTGGL